MDTYAHLRGELGSYRGVPGLLVSIKEGLVRRETTGATTSIGTIAIEVK